MITAITFNVNTKFPEVKFFIELFNEERKREFSISKTPKHFIVNSYIGNGSLLTKGSGVYSKPFNKSEEVLDFINNRCCIDNDVKNGIDALLNKLK